jgi:ATP-dependent RNA helicase DeaD
MPEPNELTFAQLGLRDSLVATLTALGYEAPTPIQARTVPVLLAGQDLIGQAQTGTGKTAAFALPMLQKLDLEAKETQALVLAPTRELAMQVAEAIHSYAKGLDVTVLPVYGGASIVLQMKHLARGAQIVVGTPGRLIDHLDRKTLRLDAVKMVVLDEADEMLKMGFIEEVERMLSLVPSPRQVALFSATMPDEVLRIAQRHLKDPEHVEIEHKALTAPAIEQRFLNVNEGQKLDVLTQILELEPNDAVLIFRRTKTGAAELAEKLEARGVAAVAMHGDMVQSARESVIRRLRSGQIEIVVATDVAARGLDVEQISHVINFDVPYDVEAYVHRIGRTGRAGRTGVATLFVTPKERRMMREIERYTGAQMVPMKMPTAADVAAHRVETFKESLRTNLLEGDLDLYVALVSQLAEEGPYEITDVAAAAARLANGSRSLEVPKERQYPAAPPRPESRSRAADESLPTKKDIRKAVKEKPSPATPRADEGPAAEKAPRAAASFLAADGEMSMPAGEKPARKSRAFPAADEPKVRLSMAVGKRDGIRPGDIVGSIANEADIPGSEIGPIDIRDEISYVVLPSKYREKVLEKVAGARFRGRDLDIRVASITNEEYERTRTPYRPGVRDERPARPKAPYRSDDRPKAPYRPAGDRPKAPYRAAEDRGAKPRPPYKSAGNPRAPYGPDTGAKRPPFRNATDRDRPAGADRPRAPYRAAGAAPDNRAPRKPRVDGVAPDKYARPRAPYRAADTTGPKKPRPGTGSPKPFFDKFKKRK